MLAKLQRPFHVFYVILLYCVSGLVPIIQGDELIKNFARHHLLRKGDVITFTEANQIRSKLRFLGRLLIKLRAISEKDYSFMEFLKPAHYNLWVRSVIELRQMNKQLAVTVSYYTKKLAVMKKAEGILRSIPTMKEEASNFLDLYSSSWSEEVLSSTIRMQQQEKVGKPVSLPKSEDLQRLTAFIDKEIDQEVNSNQTDFIRLQKLMLAALLVFNKRRPAEVAEVTVADYRRAQADFDDKADLLNFLTIDEKSISQRYTL